MKIAMVAPGYPPAPGGVETVVAHSARALVRAGLAVEVLTQEPRRGSGSVGSGSVGSDAVDSGSVTWDQGVLVRRFSCNRARTYRCAPGLYWYLNRHCEEYDVVHGHSYHALTGVAAALCLPTKQPRTPYVFTPHYHGTGHTPARELLHHAFRPLGRAAATAAEAIVCVSPPEADLLRSHFPHVTEKITIIPNAVDATAIRAAHAVDDQPPTVLSVGRLERYKHTDLLIEALAHLPVTLGPSSVGGPLQLVVIGSGPDGPRLRQLARDCGVADRVRFLGQIADEDVHRWLRTARVLCSLSEREAYGLAPAEALVAGARVVLSDIPAHAALAGAQPGACLVPADAGTPRIAATLADALRATGPGPAGPMPGWDDVATMLIDVYRAAAHAGAGAVAAGPRPVPGPSTSGTLRPAQGAVGGDSEPDGSHKRGSPTMGIPRRYTPEPREPAVLRYRTIGPKPAIRRPADPPGARPDTLPERIGRDQPDRGERGERLTTPEHEEPAAPRHSTPAPTTAHPDLKPRQLAPPAPSPSPPPAPQRRPGTPPDQRPRFGSPAAWLVLWTTATGGAVLVALSFSLAAASSTGTAHFAVFWLGMVVFFVPAVVVTTARHVSDKVRIVWMLGYGIVSFVPKLLRDPSQPLFHDEIAHWRQTTNMAADGKLFQPSALIHIIDRFPGLHLVTASISDATGMTVWQSALVLMLVAHILALFGAFMIGDSLFGSMRAGAVVALLYSLNPSFMYFDTQFAYESLAMPLLIWCVACLAKVHRAEGRGERVGWSVAAALLGLGVLPTHHLAAAVLVLLLLMAAAITWAAARRGAVPRATAAATTGVALTIGGAAAAWLALAAPGTFAYLSPYLRSGSSQLLHLFSGSQSGARVPFQAGAGPFYERLAAFTVPVLALVLAVLAIRQWWRTARTERRAEPLRLALGLFGLLYFPALPFILAQAGAEGARRSWGFTYIGLAVLVAPIVLAGLDRLSRLTVRASTSVGLAATLLACDALMGNVAAGLNADYRFPGPFVFGSDARSSTAELASMSQWIGRNLGSGVRVVSDRYTGLSLVRDAGALPAAPSTGFATYDLYVNSGPPSAFLVQELSSSNYTYLVIDERLATQSPQLGVIFEPDEPFAHTAGNRVTSQNLARYHNLPWTTEVYESDNYSVYRFDFNAIHDTVPTPPGRHRA
ncbi:glycosyltransferase involved in cell wall biosynthesis [Streptacidiphilus sp. MAP12-20]|uniref:glycosyltransferase n=1 Tax=Streptacidiphilus sp. MAP12-20 TaxID=3156299 RepID=UPI0035185FCC